MSRTQFESAPLCVRCDYCRMFPGEECSYCQGTNRCAIPITELVTIENKPLWGVNARAKFLEEISRK